jgi:hypothetical protein
MKLYCVFTFGLFNVAFNCLLYNVESFVEMLLINWKGCRRQRCCNPVNLIIANMSSAKIHFYIIRRPAVKVTCLVAVNILLDHECDFRRNRLTTGHVLVLCIRKILEKNGKIYNVTATTVSRLQEMLCLVCFIHLLSFVYSLTLVSC